ARVISLQLGNGCSAAAVDSGTPLDCSMGFTPLEGLVMGTRAGDIDPGIVLQLLRAGMSADEIDDMLQQRSGLLGLSGETGDMRRLLQLERDGHAGACLAIEVFCQRVRKYIGAYLAVLGGADAIVFGGGIGEHAAEIRSRCLSGFEWAGLRVDTARNRGGGPRIHADGSRIGAYVLHTDEESVIAADAAAALSEGN
ncbi:MAG: acetate/propionate family kinase, partial [Gammaproteobacteria bacterium]